MRDELARGADRYSRREWVLGTLLLGLGASAKGQGPDGRDEELTRTLKPVFARARAAMLTGFRASVSTHYAGIGDAPDQFREDALSICESLAKVYTTVFGGKGFPVEFPASRMTVVTLKDRDSYASYLGESPGQEVGGHYDLEANELVMFDARNDPALQTPDARRINEFTLVHEALHQLNYNTGLLDRRGDVPDAISEGLAMYGELWQHTNRRSTLGVVNEPRLQIFRMRAAKRVDWFPVQKLLTDDALFRGADAQLAYAESWVLVHSLIRSSLTLPKFQAYLRTLKGRTDASRRVADATEHFGDLAALDRKLKKYALSKLREI